MARKKTEATEAAKKTTKTTTKKSSTKKSTKSRSVARREAIQKSTDEPTAVVETKKITKKADEEVLDGLVAAVSDESAGDSAITVAPRKDAYELSLEQIEKYKATHNGADPGLDLEQVKKDAMDGFTTILIDDVSGDIPESLKMTIDLVERNIATNGDAGEGNTEGAVTADT